MNKLLEYTKRNILVLFLLVLCFSIAIVEPRFLTSGNILNVMIQISINALVATSLTFVILTGGIDLSVGSIAAVAGIVGATLVKNMTTNNVFVYLLIIIVVSVVVGGICGGVSAFCISKLNVSPFIATLAMLSIARGVAYVVTGSKPVFQLPEAFSWLGQDKIFGVVPVLTVLMILVLLISYIVLEKTAYGRHVYAVGSNEEVARLSGIKVKKIKASVYIISGILAALGGVCLASKLGTGQPNAATGYELTAIAAVVMGGTSLKGGSGGIKKTVIGIITIGVLNNGMNLMKVSSYWQTIVMGAIILLAVILDQMKVKKQY